MVVAGIVVTDIQVGFNNVPNSSQILSYFVFFRGTVSDGTVTASVGSTSSGAQTSPLVIPVTTRVRQIDRLIREGMASACFQAVTVNVTPQVTGFVIDPDDIYIPFS